MVQVLDLTANRLRTIEPKLLALTGEGQYLSFTSSIWRSSAPQSDDDIIPNTNSILLSVLLLQNEIPIV
jgi:hypothetical protein